MFTSLPKSICHALVLLAGTACILSNTPAAAQSVAHKGPPLSGAAALHSYYAKVHGIAPELKDMQEALRAEGSSSGAENSQRVNADYNFRPQDEPAIGILKGTGGWNARWVVGANDYAIGTPIGGGMYNSEGVTYFPPFPFLDTTDVGAPEPVGGTGDPSIASGHTRASATIPAGKTVMYYASLAFSASFCENGVQVARSLDNGYSWNRTRVPLFGASGFVTYWPLALDCSVFNDKEWIAVDNTGGPHDGRVYVTWTRFLSDSKTAAFIEAPIYMAYSDDNAATFSQPMEISGSAPFCTNHSSKSSAATECNEDQFSQVQVLPNGDLAVSFENSNGIGFTQGQRGQMLAVVYSPASNSIRGPYQIAPLVYDGLADYPFTTDGTRQTFCNSNFRNGTNGSLAADKSGALYFAYFDDKKHQGEFAGFPTVGPRSTGYACPAGKATDTDIYVLKSVDGARHWTDITPARGHAGSDQFWPAVAAGGGQVVVVFNDRSYQPGNKLVDVTLARLGHEGEWQASRIAAAPSNFDNAFFGIGAFAGDYIDVAVDDTGTWHAVWTCVAPGKNDSDICIKHGSED
ncbi:MAG: hypothetical protein NVSMB15_07640 [Steroidobacteraceae bacterium]